jgi:hypothetical protein
MRWFLTIALICALLAHTPFPANAEVNRPAIAAAMGLWGYITGVDVQIAKCREIDSANADSYDLAYTTYHSDVTPLLLRIDILLTGEMARVGAPKDLISSRQQPIMDSLKRETQRTFEANPTMWLAACRELPTAATNRIYEFQSLRERYPEWMRLVDEWR